MGRDPVRRRSASPQAPIALAEVQGYVYAAYLSRAQLAAELGDQATASSAIKAKAADLRATVQRGTSGSPTGAGTPWPWTRDKRPVDGLGTNMGHCLWSGIVDEDKAEQVADRLLSPGAVQRVGCTDARHDDGHVTTR